MGLKLGCRGGGAVNSPGRGWSRKIPGIAPWGTGVEAHSQRRGGRRLCQPLGKAKYNAERTVAFGLSAQVAAADVTENSCGAGGGADTRLGV